MVTSQASRKKQSRNSTIELMRFIFTVGVCLHHFYSTFVDSGPYPFYNGYFAVEFFFVIGGYFLASSIDKISNDKPLWQNSLLVIKSRFFKLLIPFYVGHSITFILRNLFIQTPSLTQWFINYISDFSLLTFVRQAGFDYFYGYGHTWYISSMFLSFLIIVPLLIHYRKNFIFLAAPVIATFIFGYMNHEYGKAISDLNRWSGLFLKGQMRAFADICLGIFLFGVTTSLRKIHFTKAGIALLSFIEVTCYGILFYYMFSDGSVLGRRDYSMLFFLIQAIMLSMSNITFTSALFANKRIIAWLGQFSLYLYLMHYIVSVNVMPYLLQKIPDLPFPVLIYLFISFLCSFILWGICLLVEKHFLPFLKNVLIVDV